MILKKLTINQFGPFSSPVILDVSSNVTVLTGANDTGKSSILRLIEIIFDNTKDAQRREYNIARLAKSFNSWDRDDQWYCDAELEARPDFQDQLTSLKDMLKDGSTNRYSELDIPLFPGDKITFRFYLAPNSFKSVTLIDVNGKQADPAQLSAISRTNLHFFLPKIINLSHDIGAPFYNSDSNLADLTKDLLDIAFDNIGLSANDPKLINPSREDLTSGAAHLNEKVQQLFNQAIHIKFRFELSEAQEIKNSDEDSIKVAPKFFLASWPRKLFHRFGKAQETPSRRRIDLCIEDELRGETHLSYRGSGVSKIAYLISNLLKWGLSYGQSIILLDEPENSLHADSQHALRTALEGLAQNLNIQVIYSTHSPSMINPLRAENIRLVKREARNNQVTSTIDNRPFDHNFLPVRTSLGLSPADSLLYAPITVIVEGVTEVLCVPFLLKRFQESGTTGFEGSEHLLSMTHFLNGEGSSYEYFCRLAKSQGNKVIIFLDGDKKKDIKKLELERKHLDVRVIFLDENSEFEEIVPRPIYFKALVEITNKSTLPNEFDEWQSKAGLAKEMMFSKKVGQWMSVVFNCSYSKPEVMRRAVELADISVVNPEPFKKLIRAIRNAAP